MARFVTRHGVVVLNHMRGVSRLSEYDFNSGSCGLRELDCHFPMDNSG